MPSADECGHVWTNIAPEYVEDRDYDPEEGSGMWEWCIRCGCLRLGEEVFKPGPHQTDCIRSETEIGED